MEHESTPPPAAPVQAASVPGEVPRPRGIGRRSLLRAGAGAAPILLTLHSGPVSATGSTACTVASSFVSATTFASRSPGATYIKCSTKNAGHWRSDAASGCSGSAPTVPPYGWWNVAWPTWACSKIKDHLCATGSAYDNDYVGNIMKNGSSLATSGNLAILQHIMGLTLTMENASSYITTAGAPGGELSKAYLVAVWQQYRATGKYSVAAENVDWDEAGLLSWLKMLQYDIPV